MAGLFDDMLAPEERSAAPAAVPGSPAPAASSGGLFGDMITPDEQATAARQAKLKAIAYQSMTGDLGSKDANDLMSLGDIGIDKYSWGAARPLTAAINAFSGQGFPADSTFGERYGASESAYDRKIAEDKARTGGVGKMVGGVGTVASLAGPAEIGALTKAGDWAVARAAGPVTKWLATHSFKPALDIGTGSAVQGASESSGGIGERAKAALVKGGENAAVASVLSPAISLPAQGAYRVLNRPVAGAFNLVNRPANAVYDYLTGGAKAASEAGTPAAAEAAAPTATAPDMAPVYDRFRGSNTAYSYNQLADFSKNLTARLAAANIPAESTPIATKIYNATGTATPEELAAVRSEASGMAGSADPHTQKIGQIMVNALDDFTGSTNPAKTSLAPDELNSLMGQYRQGLAPPAPSPAAAPAAAPAADIGAPATPANAPSSFRNALGFIDRRILHPGAVLGAGSTVTSGALAYGADPYTASILGGGTTAALGGLKAALRVASRGAGEAGAEAAPDLSVPTRENLARLRALGVIRDASNLGTASVFANAPGGGGGGGGF